MGNICCRDLPGDVPYKNIEGQIASFGMQCFWEPEARFGVTPGVIRVQVGYCGGTTGRPTYENMGDYTETVEVEYDPAIISYSTLLDVFFKNSNLFLQYKKQYESIIFYHTDEQKNLAEAALKEIQLNMEPDIVTKILPATKFYNAEDYHQKFRLKQHVKLMRMCGRLTNSQIRRSHVLARLNGYLCFLGTLQRFESEIEELKLSSEMAEYVRTFITME